MSVIAMMHGDADGMMGGGMMGDGMMGGGMMGGGMGVWMLLWGLVALALLVLAVVATIWLIKHLNGSSGTEHQRVLERRYAAGEIDRDEFLQRRDDLARRR